MEGIYTTSVNKATSDFVRRQFAVRFFLPASEAVKQAELIGQKTCLEYLLTVEISTCMGVISS